MIFGKYCRLGELTTVSVGSTSPEYRGAFSGIVSWHSPRAGLCCCTSWFRNTQPNLFSFSVSLARIVVLVFASLFAIVNRVDNASEAPTR